MFNLGEKDLKSGLPDTSQTLRLKGIDALIEIYRDRYGVPHVLAQTARDAFFDTSDWDNSCWVVPLGVSGHPASPHYADQAVIWGALDLVPMRYRWDRVKAEAASHQTVEPE
ncbi:MAG: penicillin acylase family protein [Pseudomonadota bacterium]